MEFIMAQNTYKNAPIQLATPSSWKKITQDLKNLTIANQETIKPYRTPNKPKHQIFFIIPEYFSLVAAAEEKKKEESEESDDDMGFGLFD